jgi:CubicO group peptidase (beta-lactamase class C family)
MGKVSGYLLRYRLSGKGGQTFFSGGAGLSSTAKDYAVFLQMYLNGGEYNGVRLLSRTTVRSIMGNQTGDLWGGDEKHYGLAFGVVTPEGQDKGGLEVPAHSTGEVISTPSILPTRRKGLLVLLMKQTQGDVNDQTGWKFRQLVFQTIDD